MDKQKLVKDVKSRDLDFAQWYTDICTKAKLMSYSDIKGFIIYEPYGYAIWENIQKYFDDKIKKTGHENVYMPMLICESLFQKEKDHVIGFAPETAVVTIAGNEKLSENLIIRPTSEVLFCKHFAKTITSYRDLPKKYNQWCSVVRWEKTTRPFLRGSEFLWQEGHTVHATESEAIKETLDILAEYVALGKDLLAIPFVTGKKTQKEKFAGAIDTYSIEALMYDGKALQSGTSHYFGQGFAKAFEMKFTNSDNKIDYMFQTSWGISTRLIGAMIMVHGDDNGLVLPPYLAPIQVVIIPVKTNDESVMQKSLNLYNKLIEKNIRVKLDDTNKSAGWKFSEYEMKGIPLRIEIGPRDLVNGEVTLATRYNTMRQTVKYEGLEGAIDLLLKDIHQNMYNKALDHLNRSIHEVTSYEEFKEKINIGGYVRMSISGPKAEEIIKEQTTATARVIEDNVTLLNENCPVTGEKATMTILFAKAY